MKKKESKSNVEKRKERGKEKVGEKSKICKNYLKGSRMSSHRMHLIPHLDNLLDELFDSIILSKINLRGGYHHVRGREGDE
ncbi:hypothetical protein CR513_13442, partial [Mucuna pruriens]